MRGLWKNFIILSILGILALIGIGIYIVVNHVGMATRTDFSTEPANFWLGLWQGFIICLSFIASWFDNNVVLYQVHNNGFWYNFGFIIGIMISIGGNRARTSSMRNRRRKNSSDCF
jgi:hypothetical protein